MIRKIERIENIPQPENHKSSENSNLIKSNQVQELQQEIDNSEDQKPGFKHVKTSKTRLRR